LRLWISTVSEIIQTGEAVGFNGWLGGGWLHAALGHLYKPDEITRCIFCSRNQFAASDISHCLLRLAASIED
jgi:hypothetical protein